jgi:hypothetical protein
MVLYPQIPYNFCNQEYRGDVRIYFRCAEWKKFLAVSIQKTLVLGMFLGFLKMLNSTKLNF